ncbi:MAG: hypothetical protein M3Q72_11060 [Actinomycetota bacterium]|nr:hypothetical protein [Actinomycetota bacterium]
MNRVSSPIDDTEMLDGPAPESTAATSSPTAIGCTPAPLGTPTFLRYTVGSSIVLKVNSNEATGPADP